MKPLRVLLLVCALAAAFGAQPIIGRSEQTAASAASASGPFDSLHFRPIGPASMSGRISDLAVYEANPSIFYVGTAHGGVWKTINNGTTFEAAVPGRGADVDRRRRRVAEQSRSGVGRDRRVEQPPEHVVGRRRLQVHRRRQDVDEHGARRLAAHQPHRHRSAQQRRRLRGGHRQPVRTRRRARRLQDDRRRQDVEAGAEGRRRHRRQRSRDGCRPTTRCSTPRPISGAAPRAA